METFLPPFPISVKVPETPAIACPFNPKPDSTLVQVPDEFTIDAVSEKPADSIAELPFTFPSWHPEPPVIVVLRSSLVLILHKFL